MKKFKKLFGFMVALSLVLVISGCTETDPGNVVEPYVPPIKQPVGGPYTITVENGTIEAVADENGQYPHNTLMKFTAEDRSATHEIFVSWTIDGKVLSSNPLYTIRAASDGHYVANFIPDPDYVPPILEPGDPEFKNYPELYRFYDDFSVGDADDNNMLDSTKWGYDEKGDGFGNNEIQYYLRDNIRIVDDEENPGNRIAVITMKRQTHANRNFTSGKFYSRSGATERGPAGGPGFASTYGKIEARIRMWNKLIAGGLGDDITLSANGGVGNSENLQGLWPAFWMMPKSNTYGGWPSSGEIDIMEIRGRQFRQMNSTIHRNSNGQTWVNMTGRSPTSGDALARYSSTDYLYADVKNGIPNFSSTEDWVANGKSIAHTAGDWHVYCIEWDYDEERNPGEQIVFRYYVDDILTFTIEESQWKAYSGGSELAKPKPFDQDFYIIFNFALGGNFDGNKVPNGTNNNVPSNAAIFAEDAPPVEYEIDWVAWRDIVPRDGEPGGIQKPIYSEQ